MGCIRDIERLVKLRLTMMVVFSSAIAYLWASHRHVDVLVIWLLSAGGFLITCASNIFNQVVEWRTDALMKRTAHRPLPAGKMSIRTAILLGTVSAVAGISLLFLISASCAALGATAMLLYLAAYTPMKKYSWLAVVPGSLAGSLPLLIGYLAGTGEINAEAVFLFLLQFLWQFPHTWSIAWMQNDEYRKAGLKMLPSGQRSGFTAALILFSSFLVIPAGMLLYMYGFIGGLVFFILLCMALALVVTAWRFYRLRTERSAFTFMMGCMLYLPLSLIMVVLDKMIV